MKIMSGMLGRSIESEKQPTAAVPPDIPVEVH